MTHQSPNAGGLDQNEAASAVGASAADPAFDAMAQRVLTRGHATTWLNHWSLLHADFRALARMNTVGFDGTLLQMRLRAAGHEVARTSADLVLPHVFSRLDDGSRITLIGAVPEAGEAAAQRLERFDVQVIDGYDGLRRFKAQPRVLVDFDPRLVIVGLGAGLQEVVASVALGLVPEASVCTAGGWIDQYARAADDYFPDWVHAARLGWAWRIAHEPKRLTKRYTVEALDFVAHAPQLVSRLEAMGSFFDLGLAVSRQAGTGRPARACAWQGRAGPCMVRPAPFVCSLGRAWRRPARGCDGGL